jgi:hypothetical protein
MPHATCTKYERRRCKVLFVPCTPGLQKYKRFFTNVVLVGIRQLESDKEHQETHESGIPFDLHT